MPVSWLGQSKTLFPDIDCALQEPNGLLAAGGDLSSERLVAAYRQGIFPWYEAGQPILWWSPNPRMVMFLDELRISKSMGKLIRKRTYHVTIDKDFSSVISACSTAQNRSAGTWITAELIAAYTKLHESGVAHSVEVWDESKLVGGLYGLSIGKMFFGESMFSLKANTSKLALITLVKLLQRWNFRLIDCQVTSPHLKSLGAREISREDFRKFLDNYLDLPEESGTWQSCIKID